MFSRWKKEPVHKIFTLEDLKKSIDTSSTTLSSYLKHQYEFYGDDDKEQFNTYFTQSQLQDIVKNPSSHISTHPNPPTLDVRDLKFKIEVEKTRQELLEQAINEVKYEQDKFDKKVLEALHNRPKGFLGQLHNFYISENVFETFFKEKLSSTDLQCVLILSDTSYTRNLNIYKKVVEQLIQHKIEFIEYTNLQPNLNRKLIMNIASFANSYEANAIFSIGSQSTSEIAKIVFPKLIKPNIMRLHKHTYRYKSNNNYFLFYFPTIVAPDPRLNSRSALKNTLFLHNHDLLWDSIFLTNALENSDFVFYYPSMFDELSLSKQLEICHETFFRLIFNWFDESKNEELRDSIIEALKKIQYYLNYLSEGNVLNSYDKKTICEIIAATVDGRSMIVQPEYWILYRLEGCLSALVNSKKSDGLALFLPPYIEVMTKEYDEMREQALQLGYKLYGACSIQGLLYNLLIHNQKYGLPLRFIDITSIKKIDYKFLIYLVKKASVTPFSWRLARSIVKKLTIW